MSDNKPLSVKVFVPPRHRPYRACFTIGVQTFYVCERETLKEARWYVKMLKIAFKNAGMKVK